MKTIFKSMLLTALVMGMATAAMAQTGVTQTITATARVLKPITLDAVDAAVGFGGVFAGTLPFLDPQGTATANVGFAANIGSVVVDATAEEPIRVEFLESIELALTPATTPPTSIRYFPVISAFSTDAPISTTNRGTSFLLSAAALPTTAPIPVTVAGGTGTGPFGIISTSASLGSGTAVDRATLLIGGKLGETTSTTTPVIIPTNQPTGTYSGTFTLNLLYAL
jgi:hypothetical protein